MQLQAVAVQLQQCQAGLELASRQNTEDMQHHLFSNQSLIVRHIHRLTAGASAFARKSQPCSLWQLYAISPYGEILCHVSSNAAAIEEGLELYDGGTHHRILGTQHLYPEFVAIELCCPRIAPSATRIE